MVGPRFVERAHALRGDTRDGPGVVGFGPSCYFLRLGVCDARSRRRRAGVADDERNVRPAADAAPGPVWSRLPHCASALAAAERCARERNVRPAAEATAPV